MKKNAIIYIDDTHAQVAKAFEKQARIFGTPEYREWRAYRQDVPSTQMVTKAIKKNTSKRPTKYREQPDFSPNASKVVGLVAFQKKQEEKKEQEIAC